MELSLLEILNGMLSMMTVIISTIVGFIIMSRYFVHKTRPHLLMGLSWIFMISPWWASSISIILALTTGNGLTLQMYVFIITSVFPLFTILFMIAFTDLKFTEYRKCIIGVTVIINFFIYVYVYYYLFTDPTELAELEGLVDLTLGGFLRIYLIAMVVFVFIFGIFMARETIESDEPELRLKGKFLLIAFIMWILGVMLDGVITLTIMTLTITRIILVLSSLFFYFGFVLPEKLKNIFIKE